MADVKTDFSPAKHFFWLDWLRFIAALAVAVCHTRGGNWVDWGHIESGYQNNIFRLFFLATRPGFEAVVAFFVLSGFLVGGRVIQKVRAKEFNSVVYSVDRVSRIYSPLIPALLLTAGVSLILGHSVNLGDFFGNLLGMQGVLCGSFGGNAPLWSLSYELWFYFLAGCAGVVVCSTRPRVQVFALIGVALSLAVFLKLDYVLLFVWLLGAFAYCIGQKPHPVIWTVGGGVITLLGIALSQIQTDTISAPTQGIARYFPSRPVAEFVLGVGLALFIVSLSSKVPGSPGLRYIEHLGSQFAKFSYTLYLIHYPLLQLWGRLTPHRFSSLSVGTWLWFLLKVTSVVAGAWLWYLLFESRTGNVRKWANRHLYNTQTCS